MFKIIAIVFIASLDYSAMFDSKESYDNKADCEFQMTDRLISLKKYFDDKNMKDSEGEPVVVEVGGKCEVPGQPA